MTKRGKPGRLRVRSWFAAALLALGTVAVPGLAASAAVIEPGDTVFIGSKQGYGGTGLFPIWSSGVQEGDPDYWAYCIEQAVSAETGVLGSVSDADAFLGGNYFADPAVQGKVSWILAHSYPALTLAEFGEASGVPGISRNDAIEATQYAIWRYTELTFDAAWNFETPDSATAYWHLIDGANASSGLTSDDLEVLASLSGPSAPQVAGSLIGPFIVDTNQAAVTVSASPQFELTDAAGLGIDTNAVVDGQEFYLDVRDETQAGTATVQVSAAGSSSTGKIVSVPSAPGGTPTADDHAQTVVLVTPSTTPTTDEVDVSWAAASVDAPSIGTSLVDEADGDRLLPATGGTVIDTVTYENLTPGVEYRLDGELMRKTDGSSTGIIASATFTPTGPTGSVEVAFNVPEGFAGEDLVAFEWLYQAGIADAIAEHTDLEDAAQTVSVQAASIPAPWIGTSATTDNVSDNKTLPLGGGIITDRVTWHNLPVCEMSDDDECLFVYVLEGELMHVDGDTVTPTGITASSEEFTIGESESSGSINVTFEVTPEQAQQYAGGTLVVFERLRLWNYSLGFPATEIIATHEDPADAAQTVTVETVPLVDPSIGTSLVDSADGDRVLPWNGGEVTDTVTFQNLTPGIQYTLVGELMDRASGSPTGIIGSTTFIPLAANGSVDVVFLVPAGFAGQSLVAFEVLYEGSDSSGVRVAAHEDLDDAAQTVTIEQAPVAPSPSPSQPPSPSPSPSAPDASEQDTPTTPGSGSDGLAASGGTVPTALAVGALLAAVVGAALLHSRRRAESPSS